MKDNIERSGSFARAYAVALALLKKRDRFEAELREELLKKGVTPLDIDAVCERLRALNVINDLKLALRISTVASERKVVSLDLLLEKLRSRGAPVDVLEAVKTAYRPDPRLLLSKFDPLEPKVQTRAARFLASRGFSEDEVCSAIEGYFNSTARIGPDSA